jgi:hypothetical protein
LSPETDEDICKKVYMIVEAEVKKRKWFPEKENP